MKINKRGRPKSEKETPEVSIFDFINDIVKNKKFILTEDNDHCYSKYMICKFLSLDPRFIKVADILNKYQSVLDNYEFHKLAISLTPQNQRFTMIVPLKSVLKPPLGEIKEDLMLITDFFDVSLTEAYQYYLNIDEDNRNKFLQNLKLYFGLVE